MNTTKYPAYTITEVAKLLHCTEDQARAQYLKNAQAFDEMAAKARATGKKVNGYTLEYLEQRAVFYRQMGTK